MALNILTTAIWTGSHMKPENGEQVDALWGQNLADNTGYLFYRPERGPQWADHGRSDTAVNLVNIGTYWFRKSTGKGTMAGSYTLRKQTTSTVDRTIAMSLWVDGTAVLTNKTVTANSNINVVSGSFAKSISHLTDGSYYTISFAGTRFLDDTAGFCDSDVSSWLTI